jgi:hypothetical protein
MGCIPPYPSCLDIVICYMRNKAPGEGTHRWCCLITTFERIRREESTTAAQVSSAEDSRARTVNLRDERVVEHRSMCFLVEVVFRFTMREIQLLPSSYFHVGVDSEDDKKLEWCLDGVHRIRTCTLRVGRMIKTTAIASTAGRRRRTVSCPDARQVMLLLVKPLQLLASSQLLFSTTTTLSDPRTFAVPPSDLPFSQTNYPLRLQEPLIPLLI